MKIIRSAAAMQRTALRWRGQGTRVGLVPTMGFLHEGHMALVAAARRRVGSRGQVVLSIYVNPAQFGPKEDFARYPRDLARDVRLCRSAGVDAVFAPADEDMYHGRRGGYYSTYVVEERLSQGMEGLARPGHFRGVTTVVAKLFNLVLPEVAAFGAKDYQQAAVIRRMVSNLNFPVRILVVPTKREPDGLALSSRNMYLEGDQRAQARVLSEALGWTRREVRRRPRSARELRRRLATLIERQPAARLDYISFFDGDTLEAVDPVRPGARMALAVWIGRTRLIDNGAL